MQNPFSKEQIKNYLLLYGAIVIIMVLFYILNSLLSEQKQHEVKVFETEVSVESNSEEATEVQKESSSRFKLLESGY